MDYHEAANSANGNQGGCSSDLKLEGSHSDVMLLLAPRSSFRGEYCIMHHKATPTYTGMYRYFLFFLKSVVFHAFLTAFFGCSQKMHLKTSSKVMIFKNSSHCVVIRGDITALLIRRCFDSSWIFTSTQPHHRSTQRNHCLFSGSTRCFLAFL